MTIYKHVFKQKTTKPSLPDTFCVGRSAFIFYFLSKTRNKVSGDQEIPQSHTADKDQA